MKQNQKLFYIIIGVSILLSPYAKANSYLDMLTTPPPGYNKTEEIMVKNNQKPFSWYDNRIQTSSPIVTSDYSKYLAYQRSLNNRDYYFSLRDSLQDTIYILETLALGKFVYNLYNN